VQPGRVNNLTKPFAVVDPFYEGDDASDPISLSSNEKQTVVFLAENASNIGKILP
jgi:ABC-type antimicrobial peptide transport system ATPase subunit